MTLPSSPPEKDPLVGRVLADRYRIDCLVGEGGMGRVYAGEHVLMRKRVAVKVLRRRLTDVADVVARFEREAMAAANIDHPNVASATDFGKLPDGSVYLVLEYVEGKSLREELEQGALAPERALRIARQIASALTAAHARSIVHRDLKPDNVLLVLRDGEPDFVKVLDFGIAKVPLEAMDEHGSSPAVTASGVVFGTPEYMAPEQALGQDVDGRADLYALGVMLYEMLAGERPYRAANAAGLLGQQISKPPPSFEEKGVFVPPAVQSLVFKLLQANPAHRYAKAEEVLGAIDGLFGVRAEAPSATTEQRGRAPSAVELLVGPSLPPPSRGPDSSPGSADGKGLRQTRGSASVLNEPVIGGLPLGAEPSHARPVRLPWPILAAAGGALLLLVVLLVLVTRSGREAPSPSPSVRASTSASVVAPAPVATAPTEGDLAAARREGPAALGKLVARFPERVELYLELARAYRLQKEERKAVEAVADGLRREPGLRASEEVQMLLWQTSHDPDATAATFALLEGPMESEGAAIAYDLFQGKQTPAAVKARSKLFFESPRFQQVASEALRVTVALRFAKTCGEALALLPEAKAKGDERTLEALQRFRVRIGCGRRGRFDCYPCLRNTNALEEAVSSVQGRAQSTRAP